ncbi:MAG: ABC transporter permease [Candidatus Diapherotrites archaeon]
MISKTGIKESFSNAVLTLKEQRLRSILTLLGIIVGIAAIITLISVGQGVTNAINHQFEKMGSNTLMVLPGKSMVTAALSELKENDAELIKKIQGVEFAIPIYVETDQAEFEKETKTAMIIGIDPDDKEQLNNVGLIEVAEGRALASSDNYSVLIGNKIEKDYFEKDVQLRQKIMLFEKNFKVIGITKSAGMFFGAVYDTAIIMNYKTLKEFKEGLTPSRIIVKTINKEQNEEVKQRITERLKRDHGQEDFQVSTMESITEMTQSVLGIVQLVLLAIAAISLVVGGIGIMNTMLMSVIERTNEIGLMKATGATNNQVLTQFITEAGIIGLLGGTIGIIIGITVAYAISFIGSQSGFELPISFDIVLFLGTVLFALTVGIISGVYPAFMASKLDPVEALRK